MAEKKKKYLLSKSTFIKGMQCRKALYLYKNRYFLRDAISPEQRAKFIRGTNVGVYARELFPGGVDASPKTHFQMAQSVEKTAQLIEEGQTPVIYEAAFAFDDVVVALDILYKENGLWKGVEVKSSRAISETYHWDAALQYYVITGGGLDLEDFSIAYMDRDFVKQGDIDPRKLFILESRIDDVREKSEEIKNLVADLKQTIALKSSPAIPIGTHCNNPYPCEFIGHCWKKVPGDSVFLLNGIPEEDKFSLYNEKGVLTVKELPANMAANPEYKKQLDSIAQGAPVVENEKLSAFLDTGVKKPFFLETFTFGPAIPVFEDARPYQQFAFGLGWLNMSEGKAEQAIVQPGAYPVKEIAELLLEKTQNEQTLWVWDIHKEKALLETYKLALPEMTDAFNALSGKFRSLKQPWQEQWIVVPSMKKKVNAEDFLVRHDITPQKLPKNLTVPQEADALYQKIFIADNAEELQEGVHSLEKYMLAKMENLEKIHQLLRVLAEEKGV